MTMQLYTLTTRFLQREKEAKREKVAGPLKQSEPAFLLPIYYMTERHVNTRYIWCTHLLFATLLIC